jgi:thiamine-phosphate pyrophosphorylase
MASEPRRVRRLRGLYAITPEIEDTALLAARVEAALDGGAAMVQYRAKSLAPSLALTLARRLAPLCAARGVPFIVNDSVALALAVRADGVHVGREDEDARAVRVLMPHAIVGVSCYADPARARVAAAAGADYVAMGSMFPSSTKPGAVAAPLECIAAAREASGLPVVAIGGITAANAPRLVAAGADMVAVISAVFDAPDVRAAAQEIARLFSEIPSGDPHVRAQPRAV